MGYTPITDIAGADSAVAELYGKADAAIKALAGISTDWSKIAGKPSTYPSDWATLTGKPSTYPSDWATLTGKPSTFPSDWATLAGKPSTYPSDWATMSNKPATFAPSFPNNTWVVVGDDAKIGDMNIAHTLGITSATSADRGYINFSQTAGNGLGAVNGGDLTWRGSAVWHSGNFNPATKSDTSHTHVYLNHPDDDRGNSWPMPNSIARAARFHFKNGGYIGSGTNYVGVLSFSPWDGTSGSTGDCSYQLLFGSTATNGGTARLWMRNGIDSTWFGLVEFYHTGNLSFQTS